jgi:hypothetical protein
VASRTHASAAAHPTSSHSTCRPSARCTGPSAPESAHTPQSPSPHRPPCSHACGRPENSGPSPGTSHFAPPQPPPDTPPAQSTQPRIRRNPACQRDLLIPNLYPRLQPRRILIAPCQRVELCPVNSIVVSVEAHKLRLSHKVGYFHPTPRKGQIEHRQVSRCRNPSHWHRFRTLILATVLASRFQTVPLSLGTDASGVQKVDFPDSPTLETANFTFSRRWAKMTNFQFSEGRQAQRPCGAVYHLHSPPQNWHPYCTTRPGNSCPSRYSIAASILAYQVCATHLEFLGSVDSSHPSHEIR